MQLYLASMLFILFLSAILNIWLVVVAHIRLDKYRDRIEAIEQRNNVEDWSKVKVEK